MAVVLVDDNNFQQSIQDNAQVIVKYYADWCGSCRLFKPKFKRLAEDERFKDVVFLDVNAEHSPEARKVANVNNLPYFATFKNGVLLSGVNTSKEELVVEMLETLKS